MKSGVSLPKTQRERAFLFVHVELARVRRRKGYRHSLAGKVTLADKSHAGAAVTECLPASAESEPRVELQLRSLSPTAPFHPELFQPRLVDASSSCIVGDDVLCVCLLLLTEL